MVKNPPEVQETRVQSLGQEDPLEKGLATHSSMLAWRIPWTEEPGRMPVMGSQRAGHEWATSIFTFFFNLLLRNGLWMTISALLTPPLWVEEEGRFANKGRRSGSFLIQGERQGILIHIIWFCSVLIFCFYSFIVCQCLQWNRSENYHEILILTAVFLSFSSSASECLLSFIGPLPYAKSITQHVRYSFYNLKHTN